MDIKLIFFGIILGICEIAYPIDLTDNKTHSVIEKCNKIIEIFKRKGDKNGEKMFQEIRDDFTQNQNEIKYLHGLQYAERKKKIQEYLEQIEKHLSNLNDECISIPRPENEEVSVENVEQEYAKFMEIENGDV